MFLRKYWIPTLSVFIVAIAGIGLYLLATQPPKEPIVIYKPVEPLPKSEVKAPVGDTSQGGHVHADGNPWHEGSHETEVQPTPAPLREPVPVETSQAPVQASKGAGNPPPFDKVPVDLWDFEATKAAMIENVNFVKANWDPKTFFDRELGREMHIAAAIASNIYTATYSLSIFLPEQAEELRTLYDPLYDIEGVERGRVSQLKRERHTLWRYRKR